MRDLVGFVDTFDGLPPPALTRSIATSCGCKKAEASTHRAIACAAYAALHPDEPANNAPANIAGSKRSMVTWRAKLRPALLLVMRERRVAALGSSAQLRAEKPEERGDGKEASALGTSASFIRCIPCTSQAGHRWLVDCRYEPPRCGAVWCGQIGCDVTIRCDCADPPAQESQPVVTPTVIDSDTETWVAAPDGTRSTLEFDSTLGFPGEGWSSSAATASSSSRVLSEAASSSDSSDAEQPPPPPPPEPTRDRRKRKSNSAAASLPSRTRSSQPPPPITIDAAVGRHALVPASIWPTYTCSEHDGRGWEVLIRHTDKRIRAVLVSFVADRNAAGKRYPKEWLLLESLLPL